MIQDKFISLFILIYFFTLLCIGQPELWFDSSKDRRNTLQLFLSRLSELTFSIKKREKKRSADKEDEGDNSLPVCRSWSPRQRLPHHAGQMSLSCRNRFLSSLSGKVPNIFRRMCGGGYPARVDHVRHPVSAETWFLLKKTDKSRNRLRHWQSISKRSRRNRFTKKTSSFRHWLDREWRWATVFPGNRCTK